MLDVGLIGLGPEWEHRYRPALVNLRHRIRVRAVHAAVSSLAQQMAGEWRCDAACGLLSLMERNDVRAVLILDTAWYGAVPAEFACRTGKPAYLAGSPGQWAAHTGGLAPLAAETGTILMPDFGHRYSPATSRLKELIATRLGRPESVIAHAPAPATAAIDSPVAIDNPPRDALLTALDWVCHLIGTAPTEACGAQSTEGAAEASIFFKRSVAGGPPATARIVLHRNGLAGDPWSAEVRCREGSARLTGGSQLEWEIGSERHAESLAEEREGLEVMLDHFSRRVVGGLIPVPTLDDLNRVVQLADAITTSLRTFRPVTL